MEFFYTLVSGTPTLIDSSAARYNDADRLLTQMNAGGYVIAYSYDAAGNITSVTNPDNYTLSFDYDEANRAVHAYDQKNNAVYCSLTATITALLSNVNVCNKYWCGHLGHLAR